jgi:septal ring factor EnvC (AmiA/AmiB activator)
MCRPKQETPKSSPATSVISSNCFDMPIESIEAKFTYHLEDMTRDTNEHSASEEQIFEHQRTERSVAATEADDATLKNVTVDQLELQSEIAELEKSLASAKADLETAQKNVTATKEESVKATESA